MAKIQMPHTVYRFSEAATILDSVGNYTFMIGLVATVYCIRGKAGFYGVISLLMMGVGLVIKLYLAPRIADSTYEKTKEKMIEARKDLKLQHIQFVKWSNGSLYIKCPKCEQTVEVSEKCKCGCDVWKSDYIFQQEIEEIYKKNGLIKNVIMEPRWAESNSDKNDNGKDSISTKDIKNDSTVLPRSDKERICRYCGSVIEGVGRFCPKCGEKYEDSRVESNEVSAAKSLTEKDIEQLNKLKQLYDEKIITLEEFNKKKTEILKI